MIDETTGELRPGPMTATQTETEPEPTETGADAPETKTAVLPNPSDELEVRVGHRELDLGLGWENPIASPENKEQGEGSPKPEAKPKGRKNSTKVWKWAETVEKFRQELEDPTTKLGGFYAELQKDDLMAWGLYQFGVEMTLVLDRIAPPDTTFVINSSTGKDSTLAAQVIMEAVRLTRKAGGTWTRKIAVAIADTGSEFPEMATRMRSEAVAINALGATWDIPLSATIVKPPAKHRLLVELCGNGKPLPPVNKKGKAEGVSSWCMDRVKAGTLNKIAREMAEKHGDYISILGTRSAESTRRKDSIQRHSDGLPLGLSRIDKGSNWGLAFTPITMWPNKEVSDFLRAFPSPWRPEGRQELREIYAKGSPLEDDIDHDPTECVVSISEEGIVSNSCSDLSGTRYGCWHCFLSENRSLKNTSRREPKYAWLRRFHAYIRIKAKAAIDRSGKLKEMGFTREDSFTKTFSFLERYKMLMFLYRAEAESGLKLLEKEEEETIASLWEKHGVFTVTPADARRDAEDWRKTGRWKAFFEGIEDETWRLSNALSEGIPFGALHAINRNETNLALVGETKKKSRERPLELSHLLAIAGQGFGSPPYPKRLAYIYKENLTGRTPKIVTAITDTPSLLGLPTNTGLLNGSSGTRWDALGIRQPLPWELDAAQDRNFVYSIDPERPQNETALKSCPQTERMEWAYQLELAMHGCKSDDPLKDAWFDTEMIASLKKADRETLSAGLTLCSELAASSDILTDHFGQRRAICLREIAPYKDLLLTDSPEGREAAKKTREIVRRNLQIAEAEEEMQHYARLMRIAAMGIRNGVLNTSLILKLCYISHMAAVDPKAAAEDLGDLLRIWPHESEADSSGNPANEPMAA